MKTVQIYTDGACSGNPGPGGWACVLSYGEHEKNLAGFEDQTTNNRMEVLAVIKALELLREPCEVHLYSDSTYVIDTFAKGWLTSWKKNGWKTKGKAAVKNQDLWQRLDALQAQHTIHWHKVKGHADDVYNNTCDALAKAAIDELIQRKRLSGESN